MDNKRERADSWTPRRVGPVYCSPACGGGCTLDAYQKANRNAEALAQELGKGFAPRVWENLGWHYSAGTKDGTMSVHPNSPGYTAFFNRKRVPCNMARGNWVAQGVTPQEAIAAALQIVQDEITTINNALDSYRDTIGG